MMTLIMSTNIEDLNNHGYDLYTLHKYNEALQFFDKALELDPNNVNTIYYRGLVHK